jgi:2-aminoadipate transaminase
MDVTRLLAARTAVDVGEGLKEILTLAGATDVISFAGGFPDPATFPGTALVELLEELVKTGDSGALQYSPTPGLASTRAYLQDRIEALEGRRPAAEGLMVTSGAVEAIELGGDDLACFDVGRLHVYPAIAAGVKAVLLLNYP